jgi:hypothetical protein
MVVRRLVHGIATALSHLHATSQAYAARYAKIAHVAQVAPYHWQWHILHQLRQLEPTCSAPVS